MSLIEIFTNYYPNRKTGIQGAKNLERAGYSIISQKWSKEFRRYVVKYGRDLD